MSWGRRAALWLAVWLGVPAAAHAQLLDRYVPTGIPGYPDWFADASSRATAGYEPVPVRLGGFLLDPVLTEGVGYDSNPANAPGATGRAFIDTSGALHIGSDWSRNAVDAALSVDDLQYVNSAAQSYTSWLAALGGRLDIGRDSLTAAYDHTNSVSLPTEVGVFAATAPVATVIDDGRLSYNWQSGQLGITPGLEISSFNYSGGGLSAAGTRADDRTEYTGRLAVAYALSGSTSLLAAAQATAASFPYAAPGQPKSDSRDVSILFGVDYRPVGVLRVRALVGYEQLDYSSSRLAGAAAPAAELDLIWTPTALTTISGQVLQSVENSPGTLTGDYIYTDAHVALTHEYARDVVLDASLDYAQADTIAAPDRQRALTATLGARWKLNRGLELDLSYQFQKLDSSGTIATSVLRHVVTLGVTLRPGAFD